MTPVVLQAENGFVSLVAEQYAFERRRKLDSNPLRDIADRYRLACERMTSAQPETVTLLSLGRELYRWLDGAGWLAELRERLVSPFTFEVRTGARPDHEESALLQAPWELLADEGKFLAADELLRFAPARRLGRPVAEVPDPFRLGVAFMASSPRGTDELDYEAEEAAILNAARNFDLFVEDSGDPTELGRRLADLTNGPPQVLHLSCHGQNAWRRAPNAEPEPVLLMEDEAGNARPTSAADLVGALGGARPRLVFLSACLSAAANSGPVSGSFASMLVGRAGLPAVLGWDGSVADVAATEFAREFYTHLTLRLSVAAAAAAARQRLLRAADKGPEGLRAAAMRRDWHLARVWLGAAPLDGGGVGSGRQKRSLLAADHGYKQILAQKRNARLEVADSTMFVGRRRELQRALRTLADDNYAGILVHGMGRLGKSSLAARIADRRPDLKLVVVFESYDALSVLDDLDEALVDCVPVRELLAARRSVVRDDPNALYPLLVDLLCGPCSSRSGGKPILMLVDDLERILEADPDTGGRLVRAAELPTMRAILRAFDPSRSESRLIVTSRFPFSLVQGDAELTRGLFPIPLAEFPETARRKLARRQLEAARTSQMSGSALSDTDVAQRVPLLISAEELAGGNPGLQDLIGHKLVLRAAVPVARVTAVLGQMAAYRSGGNLPADEDVRAFLENLAVDELLREATPAGRELLRAGTIFDLPVPASVFDQLAATIGGSPNRLRDLGLLELFEEPIDRSGEVLTINTLVAGRLAPLTEIETTAIAVGG